MKNTFQCPKCDSVDVIRIQGQRYNQNQIISLSKWATVNAVLDRYICTSCGYTEEWVQLDKKFEKWVAKNRDKGDLHTEFV